MQRLIDANKMLEELKPITYDMEQNAVTIADMSNIMRNWVMRQPTIAQWIRVKRSTARLANTTMLLTALVYLLMILVWSVLHILVKTGSQRRVYNMKVYTSGPYCGYQQDDEVEVYSISQPEWLKSQGAYDIPLFLIWRKDINMWSWEYSWQFKPSPSWEEQCPGEGLPKEVIDELMKGYDKFVDNLFDQLKEKRG